MSDVSLAGDAVVWGEMSPNRLGRRQTWTARLGRAGHATRIRFRSLTPPTTLGLQVPRVAASATHLALMPAYIGDDGSRRFRLLAGPLEGPLSTLNGSILSEPALLDWSGSVLVATEGDRRGPVFIARNAAAGFAAWALPLAPGIRDLRAAGSWWPPRAP